MNLSEKTREVVAQSDNGSSDDIALAYSLLRIFLGWIAISSILSLALANIAVANQLSHVINFASILTMVIIGIYFTTFFAYIATKHPRSINRSRRKLLFICLLIQVILVLISKVLAVTSIAIGTIATANLLIIALLVGSWIVIPLTRPAELVVVSIVMSLADVFSVSSGPTAVIAEEVAKYYSAGMKGSVPLGDFLLLKMPVVGEYIVAPAFGVADWIVIVFFIFASKRFGIKDNVFGVNKAEIIQIQSYQFYLPIPVIGLILALFIARVFGGFVPALPFISGCFTLYILARYKTARQLTRSDWYLLIIFSVLLVGLTAARVTGMF